MLRNSLVKSARLLGRTPMGARLGRAAYRVVAEGAAARLARVPGVDSVYLSGSLTRPEELQPGYSDIDLVVLATLPTVNDELVFRDGVARVQRAFNAPLGPLFKNVDYLELRDLELYRSSGDIWSVGLDGHWQCLAGTNRLNPGRVAPTRHQQVQRVVRVLRRWFKASSNLLHPNDNREPFIVARGVRRLLGDMIAARLDVDRLEPLEQLLERVDSAVGGEALAVVLRSSKSSWREPAPMLWATFVSAALEVLETLACDLASGWTPAVVVPNMESSGLESVLETAAKLGEREGFMTTGVVRRSVSDNVLFVVAKEGSCAVDTIPRFRRLLASTERLPAERFPWAVWPVLLTPRLFAAGFLFDANLRDAASVAALGDPLPPLSVPPDSERQPIDMARRLAITVRARGRRFRPERAAKVAPEAPERERETIEYVRAQLEAERSRWLTARRGDQE